MARLGWDAWFGGQVQLRFRVLENQTYGAVAYQRFHEASVGYSRPWQGVIVGAEFDSGRDVFGRYFGRVAGFLRYGGSDQTSEGTLLDDEATAGDARGELFVAAGASAMRVRTDLTEQTPKTTSPTRTSGHFALGARRAVSEHSDLGARVDLDDLDGKSLAGVRLVDYRYRFAGPLALGGFLGAARYALATPAYGFYYGAGAQWRNVLPHLDLEIEARYYDSVARDHLLPNDPHTARPDSFYDITAAVLSLSYHF
jgi:hypothetical protein